MFYKGDFVIYGESLIEVIEEAKNAVHNRVNISKDIYTYYNKLIDLSVNYNYDISKSFETRLISSIMGYPFLALYAFLVPKSNSKFYSNLERAILYEVNNYHNGSIIEFIAQLFREVSLNKEYIENLIINDDIIAILKRYDRDTTETLIYNNSFYEGDFENNMCLNILSEVLNEFKYIHKDVLINSNGILSNYLNDENEYNSSEATLTARDILTRTDDSIVTSLLEESSINDIEERLCYFADAEEEELATDIGEDEANLLVEEAHFELINTYFDLLSGDSIINKILSFYMQIDKNYNIKDIVLEAYNFDYVNMAVFDIMCYMYRALQFVVIDFNYGR